MYFELNALFSLSISIGAIIGLVKARKADPAYFPFLWLLWAGLLNEIVSILILKSGFSNAINYNIYSLAEAILITWQFKMWRLFERHQTFYKIVQALFVTGWTIENIMLRGMGSFNSYFTIGHSMIIVLMSIHLITRVIFSEPTLLWRNPVFLICIGMIVYFTYAILVEVFWLYGLNGSREFRINVYEILACINLFTNLLFALAAIWIPMKRQYLLRY
ncbi:MAG TPA: hypothetical protein VET23_09465 [Chitinophagaceae bacterium]|nr:hypothetical protein [Chitinophagaceae bacterium]